MDINMKAKYNIKVIEDTMKPKKSKEQEEQLKDLLATLPTLRKHKISGEIEKKIRQLRSGRKAKTFTLELTRKYNGEVISVKAPVEKTADKFAIVRTLKEQIKTQIQAKRKESREMTKDMDGNPIPVVENYSFQQGLTVPKQDMVYLSEGSFLKALMKKIRGNMTKNKAPQSDDLYVGVEIELASKEDRNVVCDRIFDAGLGKFVTVKDDGSIGSESHAGIPSKLREKFPHPHEICVLAKQSEFVEVITKLCKVFREQLNVSVDKTCGLHVHLDMRSRKVETCFNNLVLSQQFLYGMLPAQRRNSRYSYPVKGPTYRRLDSRYHGINQQAYDKYGTLELRMHCGTTSDVKIINWIKLLIAIVDAPKFTYAPTNINDLQSLIGVDNTIIGYVKSRIAKFAEQHKKTVPDKEEPGTMPNLESVTEAPRDDSPVEDSEVA